ncbi:MAG: hypothetical protein ACE5GK_03070, partial [Nitrospiria bacterium]
IEDYKRVFNNISVKAFGFFTLLVAPFLIVPALAKILLPILRRMDNAFFSIFPFAKYMGWAGVIVLKKQKV